MRAEKWSQYAFALRAGLELQKNNLARVGFGQTLPDQVIDKLLYDRRGKASPGPDSLITMLNSLNIRSTLLPAMMPAALREFSRF